MSSVDSHDSRNFKNYTFTVNNSQRLERLSEVIMCWKLFSV